MLIWIVDIVVDVELLVVGVNKARLLLGVGVVVVVFAVLMVDKRILNNWLHLLLRRPVSILESCHVSRVVLLSRFKVVGYESNIMNNCGLWLEFGVSPIGGPNADSTHSGEGLCPGLHGHLRRFQGLLGLHEGHHVGVVYFAKAMVWLRSVYEVAIIFVTSVIVLFLLFYNPLQAINQIFIIFVRFKNIKA